MSLLHKIPPLVSALAFGYGVGMSAPESTITSVNAAVVAYQAAPQEGRSPATAPLPPQPQAKLAYGGDESRELGMMRRAAEADRQGASCELDRPTYSRGPRYESRPDSLSEDVDDLDDTGVAALSRLQMPDLKVSVTRRTLKYVRFFAKTDRGRGMFETWLKRSGRYQDVIQSELRRRHLPEDLIWVSMIESGFDPRVKSPAGAVGLWQFMPATGKVYGLDQNKFIDERRNPQAATRAAVHHLRDLYLRFMSWDLALAAYNMGYEQLLDAIDRYGTTDFNELARQEAIPSETASYVPKIAAAAIIANNLDRFGFDHVELMRPLDTAEMAVPPGTPLKHLAKACGVSTSVIRNMNPDILGDRLPPGRGDYLVQIPSDSLSRARAALPSLLDNEPVESDGSVLDPVDLLGGRAFQPRVKDEGESLLSLLPHPKRRHTMRDQLEELSDGSSDDRDRDDDDAPARRGRKGREVVMYRVGPGDTLSGIARQFAIDVEDVARDNKMDAGDAVKAGQLLKLRVKKDMLDRTADSAPAAREPANDDEPQLVNKGKHSPRSEKQDKASDSDERSEPLRKRHGHDADRHHDKKPEKSSGKAERHDRDKDKGERSEKKKSKRRD